LCITHDIAEQVPDEVIEDQAEHARIAKGKLNKPIVVNLNLR